MQAPVALWLVHVETDEMSKEAAAPKVQIIAQSKTVDI